MLFKAVINTSIKVQLISYKIRCYLFLFSGNKEKVAVLLQDGVDLNIKNKLGYTLLMEAVYQGRF